MSIRVDLIPEYQVNLVLSPTDSVISESSGSTLELELLPEFPELCPEFGQELQLSVLLSPELFFISLGAELPGITLTCDPQTIQLLLAEVVLVPTVQSENVFEEVEYDTALVQGQVVYLYNGKAYPVLPNMIQSVLYLLGYIQVTGSAGTVAKVLVQGIASFVPVMLTAGYVYLGIDGLPSSSDPDTGYNYVPLGFTQGGTEFHFLPQQRFFRA